MNKIDIYTLGVQTEYGMRNNITNFPPINISQTCMINHKSEKPTQYEVIEHELNHCFQTPCSTVLPCRKKNCIPMYR